MTGTTGWELLKDRAAETIGKRQERILGGTLTDMNDYKHLAGFVEGATFVLELPERMQRELDEARIRNAEQQGGDVA